MWLFYRSSFHYLKSNSDRSLPTTKLESYENCVDAYKCNRRGARIYSFLEFSTDQIVIRTNDLEENIWNVYPNPASNWINIQRTAGNQAEQLQVFNSQGQLILSQSIIENLQLNIENWTPGFYVFRVGQKTARIIKQ